MVERKNSTNWLSDYDIGTVLRDSHNQKEHALDVNVINSLTPKKYSKVTFDLIDFGDDTKDVEFINFFGEGVREQTTIKTRGNPLGRGETTTISMLSISPTTLNGKSFVIYDNSGSIGVWFNLDSKSSKPNITTDRYIEIPILSTDTSSNVASKAQVILNADSQFNSVSSDSMIIIQSDTVGNKTNSYDVDTNFGLITGDGLTSLNSTYITTYSANDTIKYHIWYNVDGLGTDPDPYSGASTPIEVALLNSDDSNLVASKTASSVNVISGFYAESEDDIIKIKNAQYGECTDAHDGDSKLVVETFEQGEDSELIMRIQVFFDAEHVVSGFERVL